jgi:UDP-N-acetylmuramoylalanine--D-glutamate ligase
MNFSLKEHFTIAQKDTTLKGPHNLINTMAAVSAVYLAGAKLKSIREGLKTFKNAPHRLELIATINGIDFVNDSKGYKCGFSCLCIGKLQPTTDLDCRWYR